MCRNIHIAGSRSKFKFRIVQAEEEIREVTVRRPYRAVFSHSHEHVAVIRQGLLARGGICARFTDEIKTGSSGSIFYWNSQDGVGCGQIASDDAGLEIGTRYVGEV